MFAEERPDMSICSYDGIKLVLSEIVDTGLAADYIAPMESLELLRNGMSLEEVSSILGMPYVSGSGNITAYYWRIGDFNHVVRIFLNHAGDVYSLPATVIEVEYPD